VLCGKFTRMPQENVRLTSVRLSAQDELRVCHALVSNQKRLEPSVRQRHEHGQVAGVTPASRREMDEKFVSCVSLLAAAIPSGGRELE